MLKTLVVAANPSEHNMGEIPETNHADIKNEQDIIKILTKTEEPHILKFISRAKVEEFKNHQAILQYASKLSW